MTLQNINELESKIEYVFKDKSLVQTALTHSSYSNENKARGNVCDSNERLEFLGDAVLQIIVSEFLFKQYPDLPEGELTQFRQHVVCEGTLSRAARNIELGKYILLGHGEEVNGGRNRASLLADAFEALLAAVFMDSGCQSDGEAQTFLLKLLSEELRNCKINRGGDYKTKLQQFIQQNSSDILCYELVSENGPDHDKRFVVRAKLNSNEIGRGEGRSKKEAEQQAARQALILFGEPIK